MEEGVQTSGLRDSLTVLFKHKYKILITFLVTVAVVTAGSFLIAPSYDATRRSLSVRERVSLPAGDRRAECRHKIAHPLNQEEVITRRSRFSAARI